MSFSLVAGIDVFKAFACGIPGFFLVHPRSPSVMLVNHIKRNASMCPLKSTHISAGVILLDRMLVLMSFFNNVSRKKILLIFWIRIKPGTLLRVSRVKQNDGIFFGFVVGVVCIAHFWNVRAWGVFVGSIRTVLQLYERVLFQRIRGLAMYRLCCRDVFGWWRCNGMRCLQCRLVSVRTGKQRVYLVLRGDSAT